MKRLGWVLAPLALIGLVVFLSLPWGGKSPVIDLRRLLGARPAVSLLVTTDLDCDWKLDGRPQGRIRAKASAIVPSTLGQHLLEARTVDAQDSWKVVLEFRALEQYVVLIPLSDVRRKRLGNSAAEPGGAKPAAPAAGPSGAAPSPAAPKSISSQIDQVIDSGHYTNLPQPRSLGSGGGASGRSTLSIENRTQYELTVLMAGPAEESISLEPGAVRSVDLAPGSYRVMGRVNASHVLPFAGTNSYSAGMSYSSVFYVQ
jgi:hypothetical protein